MPKRHAFAGGCCDHTRRQVTKNGPGVCAWPVVTRVVYPIRSYAVSAPVPPWAVRRLRGGAPPARRCVACETVRRLRDGASPARRCAACETVRRLRDGASPAGRCAACETVRRLRGGAPPARRSGSLTLGGAAVAWAIHACASGSIIARRSLHNTPPMVDCQSNWPRCGPARVDCYPLVEAEQVGAGYTLVPTSTFSATGASGAITPRRRRACAHARAESAVMTSAIAIIASVSPALR